MISKKNKSILAILVLVIFSVQVVGSAYPRAEEPSGKKPGQMSKVEKTFHEEAWKLINEEEFDEVVQLSDEHIKNDPANAMYHQFKGLAFVLKYADSIAPWLDCKSCIKNAVQEFHIAAKLDPANEDRAFAGVVLAHVVDNEIQKAKEVFEPAIKKYPGSIHLNYVGIKYYEEVGDKSSSLICRNFVAEKNPRYEGKPVFLGLTVTISVGMLISVLTAAIIISFIKGFEIGWEMSIKKGVREYKEPRVVYFSNSLYIIPFLILGMDKIEEPIVVFIASEPPDSKTAIGGTGIVIDKDNGLILTARHGVYQGDISNYKNEKLFKNIKVVDNNHNKMDGYVVHLSRSHDLAIIKVDRRFPTQARFEPSDFLTVRDKIEYEGFPDGQYGVYKGNIANTKEDYLHLDMNIVDGMSGGPIVVPEKGVVGIVLLKQKSGGNALRSDIILEYLSSALPRDRKVRKKTYSLCLKKIQFNETKSEYNRENEPKLYFIMSVNGKKILETKTIEVTGSEMQWNDCADNKFKLELLPGDRIEFKVFKVNPWILKDSVFIKKIFEKLPHEGLPDLESEIVVDGNSFIFAGVE